MTATQDDTIAELRRANIALQERLDAALSEKATLAAELAARDAALAQRATEYSERIEQQSATVDVLKVMSASPGDPQPVFALIVDRAKKLCDSYGVALYQYDGTLVHLSAFSNYPAPTQDELAYIAMFPMPPTRSSIACRAILDGEIIHIRDMRADSSLSPAVRALDLGSNLAIPLIRDGKVIGTFNLNSKEAGGFSDSQVALLQTFAEQAVIAISSAETYRALQTRTSDLQESLEYQTATSDVLKVISQSTFDLQPVLETVAATAARLCEADQAVILRREGEAWRFAVNFGFPPEYEAYLKAMGSVKLDRDLPAVAHRTATEGRPVHIDDVAAVPGYPEALIRLGKQRTSLGVPLLRDGETIGLIQLSRQRVEPFTDRQIELVSTFADQAVIAIENTRLITEQQEALEQQTATAEILQVINASPGNLAPVFEAMLEKATRLCEAACGVLWTHEGEVFRAAALRGVPPAYSEFVTSQPRGSSPGGVLGRLVRGEPLVHIPDAASPPPQDAIVRTLVELGNIRTLLAVPLRKDDALLGAFTIYREEIRPFSDKQIALLENFAAQAVIAMENARLIDEQREALEQQTATAEVLQVINASPGNLAPVFDTMLDKAMRLCDAAFGELYGFDGEGFPSLALKNVPAAYSASRRAGPVKPIPGSFAARFIAGEYVIHIPDLKDEDAYRSGNAVRRAMVDLGGARTAIAVALHVDDQIRGALIVYRQEVRPFTGKQIAVLENFAVQAVIAT